MPMWRSMPNSARRASAVELAAKLTPMSPMMHGDRLDAIGDRKRAIENAQRPLAQRRAREDLEGARIRGACGRCTACQRRAQL